MAAVSDTEYTELAPGADDIVWQSANGNPLTVPFSGDSCKLVNMVWELRSSTDNTTYTPVTGSPFTQTLNLDIDDTVPEWDGPPAGLADDTYYKAKVTYNSETGVDPVTSDEITFRTAPPEPEIDESTTNFVGSWTGTPDLLYDGILDIDQVTAVYKSTRGGVIDFYVSELLFPHTFNVSFYNKKGIDWAAGTVTFVIEARDANGILASSDEVAFNESEGWDLITIDAPAGTNKMQFRCKYATDRQGLWHFGEIDFNRTGRYFYDEKNQQEVRESQLIARHGTDEANNELGIYDLTEQPTYPVAAHVKVGDKYKPIRDYSAQIAALQARIEELENPY